MLAWPRQTPIEEVLHTWASFYASRFPSRPCVTPASDLRAPICRPRGIFLICKLKERNVTPTERTHRHARCLVAWGSATHGSPWLPVPVTVAACRGSAILGEDLGACPGGSKSWPRACRVTASACGLKFRPRRHWPPSPTGSLPRPGGTGSASRSTRVTRRPPAQRRRPQACSGASASLKPELSATSLETRPGPPGPGKPERPVAAPGLRATAAPAPTAGKADAGATVALGTGSCR